MAYLRETVTRSVDLVDLSKCPLCALIRQQGKLWLQAMDRVNHNG